jgi:hypothetical protein
VPQFTLYRNSIEISSIVLNDFKLSGAWFEVLRPSHSGITNFANGIKKAASINEAAWK